MASIIVASGTDKGNYYPLGQRTNVIGRSEALPIQILDSKMSRKHFQIRFDKSSGQYSAVDMKSKHGVFVNAVRIDDEMILSDGDYIFVGETILLFTTKDFDDRESALHHFKKVGERINPTVSIVDDDTIINGFQ